MTITRDPVDILTELRPIAPVDPAALERARTTVMRTAHPSLPDHSPDLASSGTPAMPGVHGLISMLAEEQHTAPRYGRFGTRTGRRRLALAGAAAVITLGMVGVLPSIIPGGGTPPAAAIPMLEYSQPSGTAGPPALHQLADQIRGSAAHNHAGRYFFEHRQYVGYTMHEVEVSEGQWEVDRLVFTEDHSYLWYDTTDLSGGRLYIRDDGENSPERWETITPAGEHAPGLIDPRNVPDSPAALYELVVANNDQHRRFPGHYLIDTYNLQANELQVADRATFLEAIALADDVTSYGRVTDRQGRNGIAFGASRLEDDQGETIEIESVLILDPTTGQVLELDTIYPNEISGAPDIVEDYDLVIDSRLTDALPPCADSTCPGV